MPSDTLSLDAIMFLMTLSTDDSSGADGTQAVDHPYLVVHSASGAAAAAAASAKAAAKANDENDLNGGMCGVCHDPLEQPVNTRSRPGCPKKHPFHLFFGCLVTHI